VEIENGKKGKREKGGGGREGWSKEGEKWVESRKSNPFLVVVSFF
jgi:hypothetical protein